MNYCCCIVDILYPLAHYVLPVKNIARSVRLATVAYVA